MIPSQWLRAIQAGLKSMYICRGIYWASLSISLQEKSGKILPLCNCKNGKVFWELDATHASRLFGFACIPHSPFRKPALCSLWQPEDCMLTVCTMSWSECDRALYFHRWPQNQSSSHWASSIEKLVQTSSVLKNIDLNFFSGSGHLDASAGVFTLYSMQEFPTERAAASTSNWAMYRVIWVIT